MKKFLICLSYFFILFGASTAFAGDYFEDFEDGNLNPEWYAYKTYSISNGILHMTEGKDYGSIKESEVGLWLTDKTIYHFEADVKVTPGYGQMVGITLQWGQHDSGSWDGYQVSLKFFSNGSQLIASLGRLLPTGGGSLLGQKILEQGNFNTWYNLGITIHDNYITFSINGNTTNLFQDLFVYDAKSIKANVAYVHAHDGIPDINYYADNIKAITTEIQTDARGAFYDTFDTGPIDKNKWRWYEAVRNVSGEKLHINLRSCGGDYINTQITADGTSFMKANVLVHSDSYVLGNAWAKIRIEGEFYNDSRGPGSGLDYNEFEGEVMAEIGFILDQGGVLKMRAQAFRFNEADPWASTTTLFSQDFVANIQFNTEYVLSIELVGSSLVFKCNNETITYPISGPIYASYINERYIWPYFSDNTGDCGYLKAQIDNFFNDNGQTPYDTFDGDQLDAKKWQTLEFIREIDNGKLRMKVERCNARGNNYSSPTATNDSGYLEAKVAIKSGSASAERDGIARIGSYLYNEKRGPGSGQDHNAYLDGVFIYNQLRIDDSGNLKAYAGAWRSDHPDEESGTSLLWEPFDLPIELGKEYTLSIKLIGSKIIYKCNAKKIIFEIRTPTYDPYDKHYYLNSRINNSDQQCGFVDTTFDDIRIRPAGLCMPAINFLLLGK